MSAEIQCIDALEGDQALWDGFVESQPAASLGHAFEWKRVFEKSYRKETRFLAAVQDGAWLGVLPLVRMRGPFTGNRIVSLPFLDRAGILASTSAASEALWKEAVRWAKTAAAKGIDLRASGEPRGPADRATLILPLPRDPDALWKSFSTKVRNQVRKAEKEGLRTETAGLDRFDEFYRVFSRNMRDLGSPVHSPSFLKEVLLAFGSRARLYLTVGAGAAVVGGAIAIRFGGTLTVPWASSLREEFSKCPNHSLYWAILSDAVKEKAAAFDFGRSHLDSGTYRFKVQWGAEPAPLSWASFDNNGQINTHNHVYKPSEHTYITSAWSRLPLPLANWLGPKVRQQLSN